jgi:arylsulfatase A-like enzyme
MKMKLHFIMVPLVLATLTNVCAGQRPDILWIVADDLGHGDVGFTGCTDIHTPAIDTLAESGVICHSAYSPHPFCGPSRAALMSGRYQQRFSFYGNPLPKSASGYDPDFGLPESEACIAELLSQAGYRTAIVGKWHLGSENKFHPLNHGFSDFFGFLDGHRNYYQTDLRWQSVARDRSKPWNTRPPAEESRTDYLTDLLSDEAVRIIMETDKERPLFLYLAYNAPHTPMQATRHWLDQVDDIEDPLRRVYAAMVTAMDDGIGRVTDALREAGRLDNTLIIFTSDNGGIPPVNGANNKPFRGMKGNLLEGGIRVPMVIAWPARLPRGTEFDHPVIGFDAYSTSAAAAGVSKNEIASTDSVNLLPFLSGDRTDSPHEALYWRTGGRGQAAVRSGTRKLFSVQTLSDRMFDLKEDPAEKQPIRNNAELNRLSVMLSQWEADLPATQYKGPPASKWPEQARAIGLTPTNASLRSVIQRDQKNARVLHSALPKDQSPNTNGTNKPNLEQHQ